MMFVALLVGGIWSLVTLFADLQAIIMQIFGFLGL